VATLRSISAVIKTQQQADSVLLYLRKHGQQVIDMELCHSKGAAASFTNAVSLLQLPANLQLTSLQFDGMQLQLQAGGGCQGVLGAAAELPLKQLQLKDCQLLDDQKGLAVALPLLPRLEHLSIKKCSGDYGYPVPLQTAALQRLQQLTYLELVEMPLLFNRTAIKNALQPLQAMTRLVHLRIFETAILNRNASITTDVMSGLCQLTHLELSETIIREPGALADKTRLQHLALHDCFLASGPAGVRELLAHLPGMQQLTELMLASTLKSWDDADTPAEAYAALTERSSLQKLNISCSHLPPGAWQHIFRAGRQLPHLQVLEIGFIKGPSGDFLEAPGINFIASCCPGLRSLHMAGWHFTAQQLAPLTWLQHLAIMTMSIGGESGQEIIIMLQGPLQTQ
jgi:hypothetical protein